MPRPEVSLVIPIFNEEEVLPKLDERLQDLLTKVGTSSEVVFVDDGSKDRSMELLRTMVAREPRYRVVSFSRNFGHQRAITCGMDASRGKAVVVMDADLQDPPEVVVEMLEKWREGFDVVYGRRRSREGETWFKLFTAKIFYRTFAALIPIEVPLDTGDFRLMSRRVVVAMRELRETHRFVRGLVAWIGFKQTAVEYDRAARVAGETKYPLRKMLAFAFDGIASFSIVPLRVATYLGILVGAASILAAIVSVIAHLMGHTVEGWTTIVALVSFLFSAQLLVTGVLGEYVGRIYEQVKGRPLYVVSERLRHRPMRKRAETEDFGSIGEALAAAKTITDRPPAGAPPLAQGAAPTPSGAPPPLPARALSNRPPAVTPSTSTKSVAPGPSFPSSTSTKSVPAGPTFPSSASKSVPPVAASTPKSLPPVAAAAGALKSPASVPPSPSSSSPSPSKPPLPLPSAKKPDKT